MARRDFGLHKVGRYWHADFWVGEAHIHRSTRTGEFETAKDSAAQWHTEALRKSRGLAYNTDKTVKELWEEWWKKTAPPILSESHRSRVERDWRIHILPMFGTREARTITTPDAEALRRVYLDSPSLQNEHHREAKEKRLKEGESLPEPKTRSIASSNKLLLHFHLVFSWAVDVEKLLSAVPFAVHIIEPQEKSKPTLTRELVPQFLSIIDRVGSLHVQIAVRAQLYCALREQESLRLRWEWFSQDLKTFQHGDRKAKDAPRFPVPDDLRKRLLLLGKRTEGLVLPGAEGSHTGQFTRDAILAAGKELGMHLTPHSMRHSWATMTARETGNAHLIKDGLGHKTLNTAMKYVKLNTSDLEKAQAKVFGKLATGESQPAHRFIRKFISKIANKDVKINK